MRKRTAGNVRSIIKVVVFCMQKLCILDDPKCAQKRFWSDCTNAQGDLNLRWAHMPEGVWSDVATRITGSEITGKLNICLLKHSYKSHSYFHTDTITKTRLFKYIDTFTSKSWKFSDKKNLIFSHFCSKHRLWVLVRTAYIENFTTKNWKFLDINSDIFHISTQT